MKYTSATQVSPLITSIFSSFLSVEASLKFADPAMTVGFSEIASGFERVDVEERENQVKSANNNNKLTDARV